MMLKKKKIKKFIAWVSIRWQMHAIWLHSIHDEYIRHRKGTIYKLIVLLQTACVSVYSVLCVVCCVYWGCAEKLYRNVLFPLRHSQSCFEINWEKMWRFHIIFILLHFHFILYHARRRTCALLSNFISIKVIFEPNYKPINLTHVPFSSTHLRLFFQFLRIHCRCYRHSYTK